MECRPGYEDIGGTCQECRRGFFKVENAAATCKECEIGLTTETTGATSSDQCSLRKFLQLLVTSLEHKVLKVIDYHQPSSGVHDVVTICSNYIFSETASNLRKLHSIMFNIKLPGHTSPKILLANDKFIEMLFHTNYCLFSHFYYLLAMEMLPFMYNLLFLPIYLTIHPTHTHLPNFKNQNGKQSLLIVPCLTMHAPTSY